MCKYVLLSQEYDSMSFDKDELLSKIEDFDEFEREGLTIKHLCVQEIAKAKGVSENDVFVTKLDWNYDNNRKYLANYCIKHYYDEDTLRNEITEYVERYDSKILSLDVTADDNVVSVKLTLVETSKMSSSKYYALCRKRIKKMLQDLHPEIQFNVDVTLRVMF